MDGWWLVLGVFSFGPQAEQYKLISRKDLASKIHYLHLTSNNFVQNHAPPPPPKMASPKMCSLVCVILLDILTILILASNIGQLG